MLARETNPGSNPRRARFPFVAGLGLLMASQPALSGELRPERLVPQLRAQLDEEYTFVVSFADGAQPDPDVVSGGQGQDAVTPLHLLNGFAAKLRVGDAFDLAENDGVKLVWYLHPDMADGAIKALQGIDYTVRAMPLPNLANLSIGPPRSFYRTSLEPGDPVAEALVRAADRGLIAVVAIGNNGTSSPGYINPWSVPAEVISVGAWDHTTGAVWERSSRALESEIAAWPDVVAPGVDVIGPWTSAREKTDAQRAHDESNERFRQTVPEEKWDKYTMMTGTSQAAGVVSGAAAQILKFVYGVIDEHGHKPGDALFALEVGPDRLSEYDERVPRLTGNAKPNGEGGMTYEYWLDAPWKLVKQLLIDTATPVEGAAPWESGAGLVDPNYIREQFGQYGVVEPKVLPVKVM